MIILLFSTLLTSIRCVFKLSSAIAEGFFKANCLMMQPFRAQCFPTCKRCLFLQNIILNLFLKKFIVFGIIENGLYFCKIFWSRFWSRSRFLSLKLCRSRSQSWSRKNYRVSASTFVISITSLVFINLYLKKLQSLCCTFLLNFNDLTYTTARL